MVGNNTESDEEKELSVEEESEDSFLDRAINRILNNDYQLTLEERMRAYTDAYNMATKRGGAEKLYEKYKKIFEDYTSSEILPQLRGKNGDILLKAVAEQWDKYGTVQRNLSTMFDYLDRFFLPSKQLPSLVETSHLIVYNLVGIEMDGQITHALISQMNRERDGEEIDKVVKVKVLLIYELMDKIVNERS